ncbi:MAG: PHA/PHB synthase family protein [Alphaproteobacteria bacterium]
MTQPANDEVREPPAVAGGTPEAPSTLPGQKREAPRAPRERAAKRVKGGEAPAWPALWQAGADQLLPAMEKYAELFGLRRWVDTAVRSMAPGAADAPDLSEGPRSIDRLVHAAVGKATLSISPVSLALAYFDWAAHLAMSPGKQAILAEKALRKATRFGIHVSRALAEPTTPPCIAPLPQDRRFEHPDWQQFPFRFIYQSFLLTQQWWHNATTGVHGVSRHHEQVVSFATRQLLDIVSPSNFVATNPELLQVTMKQGARNLARGAFNWVEDWERAIAGRPPVGSEAFRPGREVALTPGVVVYRNRLIELIQYKPATSEVHAEPVLIVPAWIMKYYILDLSPHNSLVKYLVERGHTVFMVSWHNPGADDRDLGMGDYLGLGVLSALRAIRAIVPGRKVNAVGYCLGGTLLAIAAAWLARKQDEQLNTVSLFAAQVDFTEAGELTLFMDESQLAHIEDTMWDQGYLDAKQMAGAFQLLRSNDLIWSRLVRDYLRGEREPMTDLMAWNADATRLPYRMHSEYLRRLFLNNDLVEGRYEVGGKPLSLGDIRVPVFAVATESDHVAPWRSVYKLNLLLDTAVSFLLTSGGHNAGIVSEPGHPHRSYRLLQRKAGDRYLDPETWHAAVSATEGSWWPLWAEWLEAHDSGKSPPPSLGAADKDYPPLGPAPGRYVLEA